MLMLQERPDGALEEREQLIASLHERAAGFAAQSHGAGTRRAYAAAWRVFEAWCLEFGFRSLPADPSTVALFITHRAESGLSLSAIDLGLAAIQEAHRLNETPINMADTRLAMVRQGITRTLGTAPASKAAAARLDVLRRWVATRPPAREPVGARDRAMLLIGFGAALRRSELVALRIGDVEHVPDRGLRIRVRKSKTDQQGNGASVLVCQNTKEPELCPARAFADWMKHRRAAHDGGSPDAALFCSITRDRLSGVGLNDKAVWRLVKQVAEDAGDDPAYYSGHSLRRGLMTAGAEAGGDVSRLMKQALQRSPKTAMGYVADTDWSGNITNLIFDRGSTP